MSVADAVKQPPLSTEEKSVSAVRISYLIVAALVLMAVALVYVWSHVNMTRLEYQVAEELGIREHLLDQQKKLKLEIATLKSPQRIGSIARDTLQMGPPERDQVVLIKVTEKAEP
ncbi:MAG: cell division protein FtsL [Syntrophales bacterium]|nr:cell division protein FtsL [Syntrophales bacterium]